MRMHRTWKSAPGVTADAVEAAIRAGYRLIDTANDYGNERDVGVGIKRCIDAGLVKRSDLFVQVRGGGGCAVGRVT